MATRADLVEVDPRLEDIFDLNLLCESSKSGGTRAEQCQTNSNMYIPLS